MATHYVEPNKLDQAIIDVAPIHAVRVEVADDQKVIRYCGRQFSCSPEMARIFLKRARDVIEGGDEELVPLLHSGGVELLLISVATPYSLVQ